MPILDNVRHELFAQQMAKGVGQADAYIAAGYKVSESATPAAASRLWSDPAVRARVDELKGAAAERTEITIHDIANQLDEDRTFAKECKAPGSCVAATLGKAKVLGLLPDKVEHTGKDGGPIETASTDHDLARLIAFQLSKASKPERTLN